MQDMKTFLSRSWLWTGVASLACFALCPYVGWYTIGALAVFGGGAYTIKKAADRKKALLENAAILNRMTRKEKNVFLANDEKEVRSIQSISKMMPYLCFIALLLNGYTYYYNVTAGIHALGIEQIIPDSLAMPLLIAGCLLWVLFFFGYSFRMNETRVNEQEMFRASKSDHSLLDQSVKAKKGKIRR